MEKLQTLLLRTAEWLATAGVDFLLSLLAAALVLGVGWWVTRRGTELLRRAMTARHVDPTLVSFLVNLAHYGLMVAVVVAAVGTLGVDTTSFLAVLGAAGLAVGLALRDSLSNFAAGVLIILFRPFKVGDWVETGGVTGEVREISILATTLASFDNRKIIIPNAGVLAGNIINITAYETRRLELIFGISYSDDIAHARRVLQGVIDADPRILRDPAPQILVAAHAESSINLSCRVWLKTADYWPAHFALLEQVKIAFDAAGLTIPFPQRDVHVIQEIVQAAA